VYLDGVERRSRATLHRLIAAMGTTRTTELKYMIQGMVPTILAEMNRAHALRGNL
jgi:phage gp16-like protein